jgi:hypothetical protein
MAPPQKHQEEPKDHEGGAEHSQLRRRKPKDLLQPPFHPIGKSEIRQPLEKENKP